MAASRLWPASRTWPARPSWPLRRAAFTAAHHSRCGSLASQPSLSPDCLHKAMPQAFWTTLQWSNTCLDCHAVVVVLSAQSWRRPLAPRGRLRGPGRGTWLLGPTLRRAQQRAGLPPPAPLPFAACSLGWAASWGAPWLLPRCCTLPSCSPSPQFQSSQSTSWVWYIWRHSGSPHIATLEASHSRCHPFICMHGLAGVSVCTGAHESKVFALCRRKPSWALRRTHSSMTRSARCGASVGLRFLLLLRPSLRRRLPPASLAVPLPPQVHIWSAHSKHCRLCTSQAAMSPTRGLCLAIVSDNHVCC